MPNYEILVTLYVLHQFIRNCEAQLDKKMHHPLAK